MRISKYFIGILLVFWVVIELSANYKLYNLGIQDSEYKSEIKFGQLNEKLALFLGDLSSYAYEDFTDEDLAEYKMFAADNGFDSSFKHLTNNTSLLNAYLLALNKNVIIDGVQKELVVLSFRGTKGLDDITTDLNLRLVDFIDNA